MPSSSAMGSDLAIKAGRKLFAKNLENYTPVDPLYETYTDKKGKQRRRKRELPPGLSKRDAKILKSVKRRAHYLDKGFNVCGMRFGWTFVIGIVPGAGDVADALLNYLLVVRKARQAEIPNWLLRRMLVNNAVSVSVGLVPVAGDIILAVFKANSRNAALLEEFLRIRGEEFIKVKQEHERTENPENVKPGAGREEGEHVPLSAPESQQQQQGGWVEKSSASSWFGKRFGRRKSAKKTGKEKAVEPAAVQTETRPTAGDHKTSKFYEDVEGGAGDAKNTKNRA
ncbi:hypothetical protein EUX98_g4753 [Antrodiella citrinella]|uniref:DUF4112 domain-containing protein n=1 Tax=Antrodiella citrinella TaxID=2447956 RepID=A0A4V3XIJ4_9APHY|nr:hypothetical protein EUX98_g4753 [Antrodiella citrinella]